MNKRLTGRGIVLRNDQLLLMERWRDELHYFSIPGGGIEGDETPEAAAVREIYEETGVKVAIVRKYLTAITEDSEHHIFLCDYLEGEPILMPDSPEAQEHASGSNRFKPGWVDCVRLADLSFEYWQPLHGVMCQGAASGFIEPEKTVTF